MAGAVTPGVNWDLLSVGLGSPRIWVRGWNSSVGLEPSNVGLGSPGLGVRA